MGVGRTGDLTEWKDLASRQVGCWCEFKVTRADGPVIVVFRSWTIPSSGWEGKTGTLGVR